MKKITFTLFLLLALLPVGALAHHFEVDGIYYSINRDDTTVTVTYKGSSFFNSTDYTGVVTIPPSVTYEGKSYTVTKISYAAFAYCDKVTKVNLPNTLKTIDDQAFRECRGLTGITIPSSVTTIGTWVFLYCYNMRSTLFHQINGIFNGFICLLLYSG